MPQLKRVKQMKALAMWEDQLKNMLTWGASDQKVEAKKREIKNLRSKLGLTIE